MFFYYLCAQIASKSQILAFILRLYAPPNATYQRYINIIRDITNNIKKHSSYELFN